MCDTLVALGNATKNGSTIFAKNSDREPNEAHQLVLVPRMEHAADSMVHCTYVEIPQVKTTNAVLLAKPFWIWGAEMGANEHGVVIGNEAVFTKIPVNKGPGLIGMDFLRLGLERASTAREALTVITTLLEKYGQGGNCGYMDKLYYHNSFIIADEKEAWVLETADRHWAAEKVKSIRTISNRITIGSEFDLASDDLVDYAIDQGWCKTRSDFDFGRCYSDFIYTTFGDSYSRFCRTTDLLTAGKGAIDTSTMMRALRDHGESNQDSFNPGKGVSGADVCMHASFGPIRVGQSVGSMISEINPGFQTHWLTGTSAPCTGVFKPVWMDAGLPDIGPAPTNEANSESTWWHHEQLHRATLQDYQSRLNAYATERDQLEISFVKEANNLDRNDIEVRRSFSQECFTAARRETESWIKKIAQMPVNSSPSLLHQAAWRTFNRKAKINS